MSTSPSWFDQEKFSRLVKKKPGAKPAPPAATASQPGAPAPTLAPPGAPIGRAATGPLGPRAGTGTLPMISSRSSTGPLPPPRRSTVSLPPTTPPSTASLPPPRSTGVLPTAAVPPSTASLPPPPITSKTGSISPPVPGKRPSTGPLPPPPSRPPTTALPPPPSRPPTAALPLPRAQTGKLPLSSAEEPAPSSGNLEKSSVRPSVPLPDFKPLFGYDKPADEPAAPESASSWFEPTTPEPLSSDERTAALGFDPATLPVESTDPAEEYPSGDVPSKETDDDESEIKAEMDALRRQLEGGEVKTPSVPTSMPAPSSGEDSSAAIRERDEARMEVIVLRQQLEAAEQTQRDTKAMASQLEELSHVIDERDSVRRDYATLREQYETLKLDRSRVDSSEATAALEEEIGQLRQQLAERAPGKGTTGSLPGGPDTAALREELKKAKEEASLATRGLALSQKALQETREALRDAMEGTPKGGSQDDLKKERATLVRQNMLLQGQNDQLNRELSAAKTKLAAKGG